jgi:hypothetical protein
MLHQENMASLLPTFGCWQQFQLISFRIEDTIESAQIVCSFIE